jgi:hypothetical protein
MANNGHIGTSGRYLTGNLAPGSGLNGMSFLVGFASQASNAAALNLPQTWPVGMADTWPAFGLEARIEQELV